MPPTTTIADTGVRDAVLSALPADLNAAVRSVRIRDALDQVADLRDFAAVADGVLRGSAAIDLLRVRAPEMFMPADSEAQRAAQERLAARGVLEQLRASQVTTDTPGLLPRPVDVPASTGIETGTPLIREYALDRDFAEGGTTPVVPAVAAGNINGDLLTEGSPVTPGSPVTFTNAAAADARQIAVCVAKLSRQVLDWPGSDAQALLDQAFYDIADRRAELTIGADLIASAGGTRTAGASDTTLSDAINAAEAAAGAALNEALASGTLPGLVIVNPANLPRVRRAMAAGWLIDPHPVLTASIGVTAGTAVVVAPGAVHLARDEVFWAAVDDPSAIGKLAVAARPFLVTVRAANGVQTVTAIPA